MTFAPSLSGGAVLTWHGTTLTTETLSLEVGKIYPWDNNAAPDATFPSSPTDGDEVALKEVVGGGFAIFNCIAPSGQSIEMPDGSVLAPTTSDGLADDGIFCHWKWNAAGSIWRLQAAHGENASAITVGTP